MKNFLLSYDTVTLRPKYSTLSSRSLADTSIVFGDKTFKLPVIPANMQDVIGVDIARWMSANDYFYIMHRFKDATQILLETSKEENWKTVSISIGVTEEDKHKIYRFSKEYRVDYITIDIAHGHHKNVESMIDTIRTIYPKAFLIVGNVATSEGVSYLSKLGVDAIKVGIGGGSICTTRYMTGFHLPTLQSVKEAVEFMNISGYSIPIIADGGAKHYGDIAKALKFGATMVMSGGWFASCINSPAQISNGKKIYRGSTSYDSKGEHKHIEGRTLELAEGFTYEERLKEIKESLQSAISYAGGNDLSAFDLVEAHLINT